MRSKTTPRELLAIGLFLLVGAAGPGAVSGQQSPGVPTMTNSSLEPQPAPLPEGWPSGAPDAQIRGAACEDGYGKEGGRRHAQPGDDVLPRLSPVGSGLDSLFLGVRHIPF